MKILRAEAIKQAKTIEGKARKMTRFIKRFK